MTENKESIKTVRVSFAGVKKGELAIVGDEVLLYKRKSLFTSRTVAKRVSLDSLTSAQADNYKLKLEGDKAPGEVFVETIVFEYKSEADKLQKQIQDYLAEKARKLKADEEEKKARELQEKKEQEERYRKFIQDNLTYLWSVSGDLFRLCAAIPREDWANIKRISDSLQAELESLLKLNSLDKDSKLPSFRELAEKEELSDLEKAAATLLEYISSLLAKGAPPGTPSLPGHDHVPGWDDIKYFFLYAALLGEADLLIALDEPGELFQTAAKLEQLSPIVALKFGFARDKSVAASLRLPKKHDEAAAILKKLVSELEASLPKSAGGQK